MRVSYPGCMAALAALYVSTSGAAGRCQLQQVGLMPVDMQGAPVVWAKINGLDDLTDAIRDYDAALHTDPSMGTALYGRGLAELRLREKVQGQNDLAAAAKLDSGIAKRFTDMGLAP